MITTQELSAIQISWDRDGFTYPRVSDMNKELHNSDYMPKTEASLDNILDETSSELIPKLITIHQNKSIMVRKMGLLNDVEKALDQYLTK